ncbi:hypothetical protein HYDPIDRAFT_26904 [Hydnomerulius pinastri MD-312]|nr:hypothetical protein HYDPIDRAFT_26904 [Hydnomerulius pinastri MD-312]
MSTEDGSLDHDVPITVNQRALVEKILARYPEEFTVFRELLQNADDASAKIVEIEFQTKRFAGASAEPQTALNGKPLSPLSLIPEDLTNVTDEDWKRLRSIGKSLSCPVSNFSVILLITADGNPNVQKIGAFGVGFYSVFSVTDKPAVSSGGVGTTIFYKGDQLYIKQLEPRKTGKWTVIEMALKEPMFAPKPFDLTRFLVTSMTFLASVETVRVMFDGVELSIITKSRQNSQQVVIPGSLKNCSNDGTMNVGSVKLIPQGIRAKLRDLAYLAGSKTPRVARDTDDEPANPLKRNTFWALRQADESRSQEAQTPQHLANWVNFSASYSIYSAEVIVKPKDSLTKALRAATNKDPPSTFQCEIAHFTMEEHEKRVNEENSNPEVGSIFQGPHGLCPQSDGGYSSRIFIGQSTTQTTGLGCHISGRFIPTVERGSIDLANGHVAKWNEGLLYVGGFLARLVYESEMSRIAQQGAGPYGAVDGLSDGKDVREAGLYTMRCFTFHSSTPDPKVSRLLNSAFFSCSTTEMLPIISSAGIRSSKDVRLYHAEFAPFMRGTPVLPDALAKPMSPFIQSLPAPYAVTMYTFRDVLAELNSRYLPETQMAACLRWWVMHFGSNSGIAPQKAKRYLKEFLAAGKAYRGQPLTTPSTIVELGAIRRFVDSHHLGPSLSADDPLPPDTIPFTFTRGLDSQQLRKTLEWEELTTFDWLQHLLGPGIDAAYDIRASPRYSDHVLVVLGSVWSHLSRIGQLNDVIGLLAKVPFVPTNHGLKLPHEAYFAEADVFKDLPVVQLNTRIGQVETVLTDLGVNRDPELSSFINKATENQEWTCCDLVRYLLTASKSFQDKIPAAPIFASEFGQRHYIGELYEPEGWFRRIGLPVLDWPDQNGWESRSAEADLLRRLGLQSFPPLDEIIRVASEPSSEYQMPGFKFFVEHFAEYERQYDPQRLPDLAFIPANGKDGECWSRHGEIFTDHSWVPLGFYRPRNIDPRMLVKLKILERPPVPLLISRLLTNPPRDLATARIWFKVFADRGAFSGADLDKLSAIPMVPVIDTAPDGGNDHTEPRMVAPRDCFLRSPQHSSEHLYSRLYTFIDFGEQANKFLKACGVKSKPECVDVAQKLLTNPKEFLAKADNDPGRFLEELRLIAIGYPHLPNEMKTKIRKAHIFLAYHRPVNAPSVESKPRFRLCQASKVVIADDLESRQLFANHVFIAPQDDLLEKFYLEMGSEYLSAKIYLDIQPSKEDESSKAVRAAEDIRKRILEKLPIFLHEYEDTRLIDRSQHLLWDDPKIFVVKACRQLRIRKHLHYQHAMTPDKLQGHMVSLSAGITNDGPTTLWLLRPDSTEKVDTYEIVREHEKAIHGDKVQREDEEKKKAELDKPKKPSPDKEKDEVKKKVKALMNRLGISSFQSKRTNEQIPEVTIDGLDKMMQDVILKTTQQAEAEDPAGLRNEEYGPGEPKLKDVKYCDEARTTDLRECPELKIDGIKVYRQDSAPEDFPDNTQILNCFAAPVKGLGEVFGLQQPAFHIFRHPADSNLMGFNRKAGIFLNLAHYKQRYYDKQKSDGEAYVAWYFIIAHELAHNATQFHDEHHELLLSGLSAMYLRGLSNIPAALVQINVGKD